MFLIIIISIIIIVMVIGTCHIFKEKVEWPSWAPGMGVTAVGWPGSSFREGEGSVFSAHR